MKLGKILFTTLALYASNVQAQRVEQEINSWQFSRDGEGWQQVQVPHDWAIAGPFDKKWDLQVVRIEQLSFPTGMDTPSFGQKRRPTSRTVS